MGRSGVDAMARGLDHIVHAVRDLDTAAAAYERFGFTVGARNRHPWGTENRIVQFPGFFVELLAVTEPDAIPPSGVRTPSFGAFNRDFLLYREGFSCLALESHGAAADAEAFRAAGIGDFEVFRFERNAQKPDGTPARVGFSLAFATDPRPAQACFFACEQHHPEAFWNSAFQMHRNGAVGIAGVVLAAENPTDHHIFLSAFVGERELEATSSGIVVRTPRGEIQVMDPAAYRIHFGIEPPPVSEGAVLAGIRLAAESKARTRELLAAAEIKAIERMDRIVVPPELAHGAAIIFESAA
ncbi:MAG TPA: VOC family protein [Xanthobacteraceae bacterium]|nr:VOC family protein [Xanthobacteraceae bacterium]